MTYSKLGTIALKVRLQVLRLGWSNNIAIILCVAGLMLWLWVVPQLRMQQNIQRQGWTRVQQSSQSVEADRSAERQTSAEENFNRFIDVLGNPLETEKQVNTLFSLARKTGLELSKAEYKFSNEKNGHYRTYQILLPVKGSYSAIRNFCEKSLLAIPFSSLDEMGFKRESIASGILEARLRFTLYLSESPHVMKNDDGRDTFVYRDPS